MLFTENGSFQMERFTEVLLKITNQMEMVQTFIQGEWFFKNGNTLKGVYKQEV